MAGESHAVQGVGIGDHAATDARRGGARVLSRFLKELPTVQDLAACEEEKLLKLWEGLGYYSRVRNMQKAARVLCERFGGEFPADEKQLKSLPGIGEYTAGAILSIAFGLPVPAVDGNVFRVLSRLTENPTDISQPLYRAYLQEKLGGYISRRRQGMLGFYAEPDGTGRADM